MLRNWRVWTQVSLNRYPGRSLPDPPRLREGAPILGPGVADQARALAEPPPHPHRYGALRPEHRAGVWAPGPREGPELLGAPGRAPAHAVGVYTRPRSCPLSSGRQWLVDLREHCMHAATYGMARAGCRTQATYDLAYLLSISRQCRPTASESALVCSAPICLHSIARVEAQPPRHRDSRYISA